MKFALQSHAGEATQLLPLEETQPVNQGAGTGAIYSQGS